MTASPPSVAPPLAPSPCVALLDAELPLGSRCLSSRGHNHFGIVNEDHFFLLAVDDGFPNQWAVDMLPAGAWDAVFESVGDDMLLTHFLPSTD